MVLRHQCPLRHLKGLIAGPASYRIPSLAHSSVFLVLVQWKEKNKSIILPGDSADMMFVSYGSSAQSEDRRKMLTYCALCRLLQPRVPVSPLEIILALNVDSPVHRLPVRPPLFVFPSTVFLSWQPAIRPPSPVPLFFVCVCFSPSLPLPKLSPLFLRAKRFSR